MDETSDGGRDGTSTETAQAQSLTNKNIATGG